MNKFLSTILSLPLILNAENNMINPNLNTSLVPLEHLNLPQEWDKVFPKSDRGVADANHSDLYDNFEKIPFDQISVFFKRWMNMNE